MRGNQLELALSKGRVYKVRGLQEAGNWARPALQKPLLFAQDLGLGSSLIYKCHLALFSVCLLCVRSAFPPEATRDPERGNRKRDTGKTWGPEENPKSCSQQEPLQAPAIVPICLGNNGPCIGPKCGQTLSLLSSPLTIFFSFKKG